MATRNMSSSTHVLLVIILVITFPVWFAVGAVLLGVGVGLCGALIGVIAALFGVVVTLIALPFKLIFGWSDWGWHWFPHFHSNGFVMIAVIIVVALIVWRKKG